MDCCKRENVHMISGVPVCRICLKGIGEVMAKAVKVKVRKAVMMGASVKSEKVAGFWVFGMCKLWG